MEEQENYVRKYQKKPFLLNCSCIGFTKLSASSMAKYKNSRYDNNYQYNKHISARTVQRYLSLMKFTE